MSEPEFKTYLCEYPYEGSHWNFEIKAPSLDDAEARLRAMCFAQVKGEYIASIPVPGGNIIERLFFRRPSPSPRPGTGGARGG